MLKIDFGPSSTFPEGGLSYAFGKELIVFAIANNFNLVQTKLSNVKAVRKKLKTWNLFS